MKKAFLEISQNSQENTCARVSFSFFIKRETLTRVFLWILRNVSEHLFYRTQLVAASGGLRKMFRLDE